MFFDRCQYLSHFQSSLSTPIRRSRHWAASSSPEEKQSGHFSHFPEQDMLLVDTHVIRHFAIQTTFYISCNWSLLTVGFLTLTSNTVILICISSLICPTAFETFCYINLTNTCLRKHKLCYTLKFTFFSSYSAVLLLQVSLCSPKSKHSRQLCFKSGIPLRSRHLAGAAVTKRAVTLRHEGLNSTRGRAGVWSVTCRWHRIEKSSA